MPTNERMTVSRQKVLAAVQDKNPSTMRELVKSTQLGDQAVYLAATWLIRRGLMRRVSRGIYALPKSDVAGDVVGIPRLGDVPISKIRVAIRHLIIAGKCLSEAVDDAEGPAEEIIYGMLKDISKIGGMLRNMEATA